MIVFSISSKFNSNKMIVTHAIYIHNIDFQVTIIKYSNNVKRLSDFQIHWKSNTTYKLLSFNSKETV
jgi:hypothetical protein